MKCDKINTILKKLEDELDEILNLDQCPEITSLLSELQHECKNSSITWEQHEISAIYERQIASLKISNDILSSMLQGVLDSVSFRNVLDSLEV